MGSDRQAAPVNLGNPDECTMLELANKIRALTGSRSKLVHEPLPADDPARRRPDISVARQVLDWSPRVPLDQGLERTIESFRGRMTASTGAAAEARQRTG